MWIAIVIAIICLIFFLILFLYHLNIISKEKLEILSFICGICSLIVGILGIIQNNQQNHSELTQLPEHSSSGKPNVEIAPTSKSMSGPKVVKLSELNDKTVCDLVRKSERNYNNLEGGTHQAKAFELLNQALDLAKKNYSVNLEKVEEAQKMWVTGEEKPEKILSSYREAFPCDSK